MSLFSLEMNSLRSFTILKLQKECAMERHCQADVMKDPRAMIKLNSMIELKYFLMTLIYQHKYGKMDKDADAMAEAERP